MLYLSISSKTGTLARNSSPETRWISNTSSRLIHSYFLHRILETLRVIFSYRTSALNLPSKSCHFVFCTLPNSLQHRRPQIHGWLTIFAWYSPDTFSFQVCYSCTILKRETTSIKITSCPNLTPSILAPRKPAQNWLHPIMHCYYQLITSFRLNFGTTACFNDISSDLETIPPVGINYTSPNSTSSPPPYSADIISSSVCSS